MGEVAGSNVGGSDEAAAFLRRLMAGFGEPDPADASTDKNAEGLRVSEDYTVPETHTTPRPEGDLPAGLAPGERTPLRWLHSIAEDPRLVRIDAQLQRMGNMTGASATPRTPRRHLTTTAVQEILGRYSISHDKLEFSNAAQTIKFAYAGNRVRLSVLTRGVLDIVAWSDQLSPHEEGEIWEQHNTLTKRGAPIAHLHHHLSQTQGDLPAYLRGVEVQARQNTSDIEAAFDAHAAQVRQHALAHGFRQFRIHAGLRLSVPLALHLLERTPAETYPIIGTYSDTNGSIEVQQPGSFTRAGKHDRTWDLTADGNIQERR